MVVEAIGGMGKSALLVRLGIERLVRGERVTYTGEYFSVDDAVLLPTPLSPIPLMIGSNGPRMLSITLRDVTSWNTWYDSYGNSPARLAALNAEISAAALAVGRDPRTLRRSACVLVRTDPSSTERPLGTELPPVQGDAAEIVRQLATFAAAGAEPGEILIVGHRRERRIVRDQPRGPQTHQIEHVFEGEQEPEVVVRRLGLGEPRIGKGPHPHGELTQGLAHRGINRYIHPEKKLTFQYTTSSSSLQKKLGVS